jgi:3-methylcrotonyl-CoA carboxylase alpha subunit
VPSERVIAVAALGELLRLREAAAERASASGDPWSPWHAIDTWWLNIEDHAIALAFAAGDAVFPVRLQVGAAGLRVTVGGRTLDANVRREGDGLSVRLGDATFPASVIATGGERHVFCSGTMTRLALVDPLAQREEETPHGGHLSAPMSGTVVAVMVRPGQSVERGMPLMVLEAMKMEHTIAAPAAGTVAAINYGAGDQVAEGADLIDIDAADAKPERER